MFKKQERRWDEMPKNDMPLVQVVDDYASDLKIQRKSPKTISFYQRNLRLFIRWLQRHGYQCVLGDLNISTVKKYILYLEEEHRRFNGHPFTPEQDEGLSMYSVQGHVRSLRALSSWLYREEYLLNNVLERLKLPKAPKTQIKILTDDEIKVLFSAINSNISSGARNFAILLLTLDSGLRVGELVDLRLSKTNLEQGQLLVNGKGNKERTVPIGTRCQRYLRRYIVHFRPEPIRPGIDQVFLNLDGTPITENSVKLMFSRLSKKCDIPRLHAHLCRHTFGTNYLKNGGDVFSLQKILGHESLSTVQIYVHLAEIDVIQKHRLYSPMDRLDLPRPNRHPSVKKRTNPRKKRRKIRCESRIKCN